MKLLQQLSLSDVFVYEGFKYCIDPEGRHGGGKIVIKNVKTGEQQTVSCTIKVDLLEDGEYIPEKKEEVKAPSPWWSHPKKVEEETPDFEEVNVTEFNIDDYREPEGEQEL